MLGVPWLGVLVVEAFLVVEASVPVCTAYIIYGPTELVTRGYSFNDPIPHAHVVCTYAQRITYKVCRHSQVEGMAVVEVEGMAVVIAGSL